ncbi:(13S,14R)-1,13-dihydroxy-N-methylcanadine 13-O-acetyltransferase AT1-like [Solanum verrucosum]|uniref:(13S,14R)-1,13-dihydroxy-N-methylcanadine 13-O-acetyltransferase AT1-like n=1 Tax=Solanum verrucosum TaxID=315347 RepID=UPI0020D1D568|nr:(13S,14R)-1,13-dihydroxy-N-methylcanadine 13-O-acetyltransferase AT1-like [Solanum verrucosum]
MLDDIEIKSRKMLKPSASTSDNLRILKLSLFDQLAPRSYVPILFNYLPSSTSSYDKLEKSLAETLTKFYPFAGRFGKDDPFSIDCNDEGVEYVQTKVNADDLPEFLHRQANDIESSLLHLLPVMVHMPSTPLLGVQVNVFNNGGIAIGINVSHIIADAFTIATFVKEWATTCLITGTISTQDTTNNNYLPSFGQLSSLFPARVLLQLPSPPNTSTTDPEIVTRRFVFDALTIENLRKTIKDDSTTDDDDMIKQPSRVVVVMSVIWKVLTHISSAKNGNLRDSSLGFSINLRGKLSCVPSSEHALGNYGMIGIANMEADEARKDELNDFVKLVGNTIRDTCAAIGKAESVDDISSLNVNNQKKAVEKLVQGDKMDNYITTSWCKLPWYEADFGWGKPFWVSPVGFNAIEGAFLMDTKDGNGIQVAVCLKEKNMTEFEKHLDILSSTPIVGENETTKISCFALLCLLLPIFFIHHKPMFGYEINKPVGEVVVITCKPEYAYGSAGSPPDIPRVTALKSHIINQAARHVLANTLNSSRRLFLSCKYVNHKLHSTFPWYKADFGWRKPWWVSSVSKNYEGISLMDTKDGDGIQVWIALKENDMVQFERDPYILSNTLESSI